MTFHFWQLMATVLSSFGLSRISSNYLYFMFYYAVRALASDFLKKFKIQPNCQDRGQILFWKKKSTHPKCVKFDGVSRVNLFSFKTRMEQCDRNQNLFANITINCCCSQKTQIFKTKIVLS